MQEYADLLQRLGAVDYEQGLETLMDQLRATLHPIQPVLPPPNPERHRILSIGGGSGVSTVGRALRHIGAPSFTTLANTGETQESQGRVVGAGIVKRRFNTIDWIHVARQTLYVRPESEWTPWHVLLAGRTRRDRFLRKAHVIYAAAGELWGIQNALDFFSACMGNTHRVIPTTETPCDMIFEYGGEYVGFYEYAFREKRTEIADRSFLHPIAQLGDTAEAALNGAHVVILGPGDVHFSVLFHFLVDEFPEVLARVPTIVLVVNITARELDIPSFTLSRFLDFYGNHIIPSTREVIALVHRGEVSARNPLVDDVRGDRHGRFRIVRAPMAGTDLSANRQLLHDEQLLGEALRPYVKAALQE